MKNPRVNGERIWQSLMEMAKNGATAKGGVCRLALSDEDKAARDLFVQWCKEAGCEVIVDRMGNLFGHRRGEDESLPPVVMGSHIDSQPTGGKFDGIFGVMAGLEVIRALNDAGVKTKAPLEVAAWTDEEGSRFPPCMVSSGVFAGEFTLEYGLSRKDLNGITLGEALDRIGYAGSVPCGARKLGTYFEAHIEQGPILDEEGIQIGVVQGVQAMRWYELHLQGQDAHSGTTPMDRRHDALGSAAEIVLELEGFAKKFGPEARATVGLITFERPSRNVVVGNLMMTIDLRHEKDEVLAEMDAELQKIVSAAAERRGVKPMLDPIWICPAVRFNQECIDLVRQSAESEGYSHIDIVSGAGHDASYIAQVAPTSMIFIPCDKGLSHNELENTSPESVRMGAQVLLDAALARAGRVL